MLLRTFTTAIHYPHCPPCQRSHRRCTYHFAAVSHHLHCSYHQPIRKKRRIEKKEKKKNQTAGRYPSPTSVAPHRRCPYCSSIASAPSYCSTHLSSLPSSSPPLHRPLLPPTIIIPLHPLLLLSPVPYLVVAPTIAVSKPTTLSRHRCPFPPCCWHLEQEGNITTSPQLLITGCYLSRLLPLGIHCRVSPEPNCCPHLLPLLPIFVVALIYCL
ncbi:hypothetical protein B296_00031794 [Ensete ventricosum]|uniref:Uncharacterized protein n=1 Tax=Ensete ventricosum TaxID=4639 RepID=A0A427A4L1_ENSVE|nr:hypothetical protein B296_00031794 [Ensete ventricosum]